MYMIGFALHSETEMSPKQRVRLEVPARELRSGAQLGVTGSTLVYLIQSTTSRMAASTAFTKKVWQAFLSHKGHDANAFGHMEILSATPGVVQARMVVKDHQVNRLGSLHGGCTSSLVDTMGSLALSSKGVSPLPRHSPTSVADP